MSTAMTQVSEGQKRLMTLRDLMEKSKAEIAKVVPKHLTADRLVKVALAAASRTPLLLQCTPKSILLSVMHCAQLGLEAGSPLGSAYLVPFRNNKTNEYEATPIVGYRGLIDLARRSGQIESIEAHVVYEGDSFECAFGIAPVLTHVPKWDAAGGRKMVCVYAVAKFKGGGYQAEVMTISDVDAIRSRSRASGSGPWVSDYAEMARKTVVRRLAKYLPLTIEMSVALETEDIVESGASLASALVEELPEVIETTAEEPKPETRTAALALKLGGNGDSPAVAPPAPPAQAEPPKQSPPGKQNPGKRHLDGVACPGCKSSSNVWDAFKHTVNGDTVCANSDHGEPVRFFRASEAATQKPPAEQREPGSDDDSALPATGGQPGTLA